MATANHRGRTNSLDAPRHRNRRHQQKPGGIDEDEAKKFADRYAAIGRAAAAGSGRFGGPPARSKPWPRSRWGVRERSELGAAGKPVDRVAASVA